MARYRHKPTEIEAVPVRLVRAMAPPDRPQWVQDRVLEDQIIMTGKNLQVWQHDSMGYTVANDEDMLALTARGHLRVIGAAAFERNFEVV